MDDFTTISEETKLYTEYSDTIDRLVKAYKTIKPRFSITFRRLFSMH